MSIIPVHELSNERRIELRNKYSKRPVCNARISGKKHTTMSTYAINSTKRGKNGYGVSGYVNRNDTFDVCLTFSRVPAYVKPSKPVNLEIQSTPKRAISRRKLRAMRKEGLNPTTHRTKIIDVDQETAFIKRLIKSHGIDGLIQYQSRG